MQLQVEQQLTEIWLDLLNLQSIDVDDDFFDLSGNSLVALQLYERIAEVFHCQLNVVDLLNYPSIRAMSAHIVSLSALNPGG